MFTISSHIFLSSFHFRIASSIPSAIAVVKAYDSASAELELSVCCVRDHAVSVVFPHCSTPPLVLLHVVAWRDQSLSVYTFTNFGGVTISIKLSALEPLKVSHNTFQIHLVTLVLSPSRCT